MTICYDMLSWWALCSLVPLFVKFSYLSHNSQTQLLDLFRILLTALCPQKEGRYESRYPNELKQLIIQFLVFGNLLHRHFSSLAWLAGSSERRAPAFVLILLGLSALSKLTSLSTVWSVWVDRLTATFLLRDVADERLEDGRFIDLLSLDADATVWGVCCWCPLASPLFSPWYLLSSPLCYPFSAAVTLSISLCSTRLHVPSII